MFLLVAILVSSLQISANDQVILEKYNCVSALKILQKYIADQYELIPSKEPRKNPTLHKKKFDSEAFVGESIEIVPPSDVSKLKILIVDDRLKFTKGVQWAFNAAFNTKIDIHFSLSGPDALKQYEEALDQEEPFDIVFMDRDLGDSPSGDEITKEIRLGFLDDDVLIISISGTPDLDLFHRKGYDGYFGKDYVSEEKVRLLSQKITIWNGGVPLKQ